MERTHQRWTIRARGRVQGVFYRAHAQRAAQDLGLTGWVRNEPDGTVTAVAEGPPDRLEAFVRILRAGPPAAKVEGLDVERGPAEGTFDGFRIVR